MVKLIFVVVFFVAVALAAGNNIPQVSFKDASLEARNSMLEQAILQYIEGWRQTMPCGNPDRGVPPLAPFQSDLFQTNANFPNLQTNGWVRNFRIDFLNEFQILRISFNMLTMRLELDFLHPRISCNGIFNGVGMLLNQCPVSNANFAFLAQNARHTIVAQLTIRGGFLDMTELRSTLSLAQFSSNVQVFDVNNAMCNSNLNHQFPQLIAQSQPEIDQFIREFLLPRINQDLNQMTLEDLHSLIMNPVERPLCVAPRNAETEV